MSHRTYVKEEDIASYQILVILNIANIFIMIFMLFIFLDNRERVRVIRDIGRAMGNNDRSIRYEIEYTDLYSDTHSDDFPYDERCSICLEDFDFNSDKNTVKTIDCDHCFHEECLKSWLRIRTKCPNCQNHLVSRYIIENY